MTRHAAAFLMAVIALFAAGALVSCLGSSSEQNSPAQGDAVSEASFAIEDIPFDENAVPALSFFHAIAGDYEKTADTILSMPADQGISAFELSAAGEDVQMLDLSQESIDSLESMVQSLPGEVAFSLVDAQTGKGIQYGSSQRIYAASSAKAWFSFYVVQLVDAGALTLDAPVYCGGTDYPLDQDAWGSAPCVGSLMENILRYSDNGAYEALRQAYEQGYTQWLADIAMDQSVRWDQSWYPLLSPAASVQMWVNIYAYMNSDEPNAAWFSKLLYGTEVSYLREALSVGAGTGGNAAADGDGAAGAGDGAADGSDAGAGTGAAAADDGAAAQNVLVANKAGWDSTRYYADYSPYESALCDSGVAQINGKTYFISVLSSLDESETNIEGLEQLIQGIVQAAQEL